MADGGQMLKHPAVAVAAGAAATAAGAAAQLYLASERLPVLGGLLRRGRTDLARRGEQLIDQSIEPVNASSSPSRSRWSSWCSTSST